MVPQIFSDFSAFYYICCCFFARFPNLQTSISHRTLNENIFLDNNANAKIIALPNSQGRLPNYSKFSVSEQTCRPTLYACAHGTSTLPSSRRCMNYAYSDFSATLHARGKRDKKIVNSGLNNMVFWKVRYMTLKKQCSKNQTNRTVLTGYLPVSNCFSWTLRAAWG